MTRRFARWLILPLALLLLCACGRENAEPSLPPEAAGRHFAAKHALLQYRKSVDAACFAEDRLVYVTTKTERRTYTREDGKTVESEYTFQTLFSTAPSGGDAEELAAFTEYQVQCANEDALWHNVHQIAAAPDGSLRLLTTHAQEPFDARGRAVHLLILNKEGRVQSDTVFSFSSSYRFPPIVCDGAGNTYLLDAAGDGTAQLLAVGPDGAQLGRLRGGFRQLLPLAGGAVAALSRSEDEDLWQVQTVDPKTMTLGPKSFLPALPFAANPRFFSGSGDYDLLCVTDLSLYGYRLGQGDTPGSGETLLSWLNCDMDGSGLLTVAGWDDGFACAAYSSAYGAEAALLTRQEVPSEETVITLACRDLPPAITRAVRQFNRKDNGFRVELRDYGAVSLSSGLAGGMDQMVADLISGQAPDLFCLSGMDSQALIDQGLLADLWPMIETDEALGGREALVQPFFDALSQNGKLYRVTYGFTIRTLLGRTDRAGPTPGWSVEDFNAALSAAAPQLQSIGDPYWNSRGDMLYRLLQADLGQFVHRESWTADFDSPAFVSLLECAAQFPAEPQEYDFSERRAWLLEGSQLVTERELTDALDFIRQKAGFLGSLPGTYIGYPGAAGNGSVFMPQACLALCVRSQNPQAAWQFLRTLLLPENQTYKNGGEGIIYYPTNQSVMDAMIRNAAEVIESGEELGVYAPDGSLIEFRWDQETAAAFRQFLQGVTVAAYPSDAVFTIVQDEADRFFSGGQTAEAAAKAIQSRVSLYLGERKQ